MNDTSSEHWPALDGLRGLAVIGVVAFHIGRLPGGFLGVDLFFVLSGFLITTLMLREHQSTGAIRLGSFWSRRFRRLLPAVMAMIGIVLAWLAIWGTPIEQATSRDDARWAIPYLANWHMIAVARDYWASAASASAFTHLWSLAIEEQFYLLWPVVVLLLARRPTRLAIVTAMSIVASGIAMIVLAERSGATRAYMGTDTRAAALLLGAFVAMPAIRSRTVAWVGRRPGAADLALAAAGSTIVVTWWVGGRNLDFLLRGGLFIHSAAAAVIVAVLTVPRAGRLGSLCTRMLGWRALAWVGTMSYGIYLWHWPMITLGRPRLTGLPDPVRDLLLVAGAVVLAAVSHRVLEQPVRRKRSWARGGRAAIATLALTAVAVVAVAVAPSGRGSVATFDAASVTGEAPAPTETTTTTTVATSTAPASVSKIVPSQNPATAIAQRRGSDPTTEPTTEPTTDPPSTSTLPRRHVDSVLWIGDSIAADAAPALVAALEAGGVTAVDGAWAGRRLVKSDGVDPETIVPPLLADNHPDLVVYQLSLWDSPFSLDQLRPAFQRFHDLVRWSGADVVFVEHPPIRADLYDPGVERQLQVVAELVAADPEHTQYIDTTEFWGPVVDRDMDDDLVPDRKYDFVHICPQGAARFARWLVTDLSARFDGITDPDPASWVGGTWAADKRYDTPVGACKMLSPGDP